MDFQERTGVVSCNSIKNKEKWWAFPDLIWGPAEYEYSAQLAWVP